MRRENLFDNLLEPEPGAADPLASARRGTQRALPKRFWREVGVMARGGAFVVALDGKIALTPKRNELVVPSESLAEALAGEWRALDREIDPARMPLTRLVFAAIDAVALQPEPVKAEIVKYAESDLLCYREATNEKLAARQAAHWDPPLAFMREVHQARFVLACGVVFTPQPETAVAAVGKAVAQFSTPLGLAALHSATTLTGSAILALSLASGRLSADAAWTAAHVDEDFQIEAWGEDAEAKARRDARRAEFDAAAFLLSVLS